MTSSDPADIEHRLVERTRALIDIPSVSRNEAELHAYIRDVTTSNDKTGKCKVTIDSEDLLAYETGGEPDSPLILLVGHTDTVPIADNVPSKLNGRRIFGRGASDMKSGLAVMLELLVDDHICRSSSDVRVGFVFFAKEELSASNNVLGPALEQSEWLRSASLAILLEPTDNYLELGCQGNLNFTLRFEGKAAHSARPWTGDNAAHKAVASLIEFVQMPYRSAVISGMEYKEVANITGIRGGTARNVIPDLVEVDVNVRYPPDRSAVEAEKHWLDVLSGTGADVRLVGNASSAPVALDDPFVKRLASAGADAPRAKQAWTNVADFAPHAIPAVNFGPGDPALAHTKNEHVDFDALVESFRVFTDFFGGQS